MEWKISDSLVPYEDAIAFMEERVQQIHAHKADEMVWLLEHPPLYTAGTSAQTSDLLDARFPVHHTGRGGQYTYHGPGQRIAYVMLDLRKRGQDVRQYVQNLEAWIIDVLGAFGVKGEVREGRVGVWVNTNPSPASQTLGFPLPLAGEGQGEGASHPAIREAKIAAIGVRVRKWVAYHGIALNVAPDLSHYAGIVPCGVREHGVTSFETLGIHPTMAEVDRQLKESFAKVFG